MSFLDSPSGHIVALFAHPDDEVFVGGTLARAASAGRRITVVVATRGEGGSSRGGTGSAAELAALRSDELAASCRALGLDEPPRFLDLPDGGLHEVEDGTARVRALLDALRPDLLLTHGADGMYGHFDHLAVHRWAREAAACPVRCISWPKARMYPVYRSLVARGFRSVRPGSRPEDFGVRERELSDRIDIREVAGRKLAAAAAHASQLKVPGEPRSLLRPGLLDSFLDEEWFVAGGP